MATLYDRIRNAETYDFASKVRNIDDLLLSLIIAVPLLYAVDLFRSSLYNPIQTPAIHVPSIPLTPHIELRLPLWKTLAAKGTTLLSALAATSVAVRVLIYQYAALHRLFSRAAAWRDRVAARAEYAAFHAAWADESALAALAVNFNPSLALHVQLPWPAPGLRYADIVDLQAWATVAAPGATGRKRSATAPPPLREDAVADFFAYHTVRLGGADDAVVRALYTEWADMLGNADRLARCFPAAAGFETQTTAAIAGSLAALLLRLRDQADQG